MPASRQRASRSAPTKPCVIAATWPRSTSSRQRHSAAVDFEDFPPPALVGYGNRDLAVEAPRAAQGGVQRVGEVGGGQDDHVLSLREAVHQRQELRDHPLFHVADDPLPPRRDGVDLVEEDDAWGAAGGLVEELAQMRLALAVELVDDLRPVDREEIGLGFVGDGAGEQSFAAAGRAVEEHALGRVDPQTIEEFRVLQRQLDDFPHAVQLPLQPADVLVGQRFAGGGGGRLARLDFQQRVRADEHGARGPGRLHKEVGAAVAEKSRPHAIAGDGGQAVQQAADVLQIAARRRAALGNQQQLLRGPDGSAADRGEFVQSDAGVLADHAVDLQVLLAAVLLEGRQRAADGLPLALHLDHLADVHAEALHVGGVDPRDSAADVAAGRFADAEGDVGGQNG